MFHMGGEQELAQCDYYRDVTNSGRSSLRLLIESANLRGKRVLLPNFLCDIIISVFSEYEVNVDFYEVNVSFEFQLPVDLTSYDALYLIKFFGGTNSSFFESISRFKECIIVDDVFSPYPHVLERQALWFSYNSLRKISPVADFSLLYSNHPIVKMDKAVLPLFSLLKYDAKNLKSSYLKSGIGNESTYIELFMKAEKLLDSSLGIYRPSENSILAAIEFYNRVDSDSKIRKINYCILKEILGEFALDIDTPFYSFLPLLLNNRDEVKQTLMAYNIFLAVHWPQSKQVSNKLSERILSIPLDSRYGEEELQQLCRAINDIAL